ncbi:hypothetical protein [Volucribacter amazonae]|uniref:hypothetical protein n=1 Tax=Volucribacter amazonae TaxID=256731 RepID=UPI00244202B7|nr:hypothetical protein [Volucribacter amazonae]
MKIPFKRIIGVRGFFSIWIRGGIKSAVSFENIFSLKQVISPKIYLPTLGFLFKICPFFVIKMANLLAFGLTRIAYGLASKANRYY